MDVGHPDHSSLPPFPESFLERLRYQPGVSAETGDPRLLSATRILGSGLVAVFQAHRIACIGSRLISNVNPLQFPIDGMESRTSIVRIAAVHASLYEFLEYQRRENQEHQPGEL